MSETEDDEWLADMEYGLQFATHLDCECSTYFMVNRSRLLPQMVTAAKRNGEEPDRVVARFVAGAHKRHLSGESLLAPVAVRESSERPS